MAIFAIAIPIIPGKMDAFRSFIAELTGPRKAEFAASRRRLKVRERTFQQHTPQGDMVVVTLEGDDPAAAFMKFGEGSDAFTQWFKKQVMDVHGVDLAAPPPGPPPTSSPTAAPEGTLLASASVAAFRPASSSVRARGTRRSVARLDGYEPIVAIHFLARITTISPSQISPSRGGRTHPVNDISRPHARVCF